uniref:Uncharacterized protein n=1 Tax=Romanomermis culicivorax TaxID=13658 RepID=A0A915I5T3_ROMCU
MEIGQGRRFGSRPMILHFDLLTTFFSDDSLLTRRLECHMGLDQQKIVNANKYLFCHVELFEEKQTIPGAKRAGGQWVQLPGSPCLPASPSGPCGPGLPALPGGPASPGAPGVPGPPSLPGAPGWPGAPAAPGLLFNDCNSPWSPGLPSAPGAPASPGGPSGPLLPAGPWSPGGAVHGHCLAKRCKMLGSDGACSPGSPGVPGWPSGPSIPSRPGGPGGPGAPRLHVQHEPGLMTWAAPACWAATGGGAAAA